MIHDVMFSIQKVTTSRSPLCTFHLSDSTSNNVVLTPKGFYAVHYLQLHFEQPWPSDHHDVCPVLRFLSTTSGSGRTLCWTQPSCAARSSS